MGNLRVFFKNIWLGPQEKDLLIAELRRQVDAQQAHINELKRGEWVAKSFDAESDRDRWRSLANHLIRDLEFRTDPTAANFIVQQMVARIDRERAVRGE